MKVVVIGGGVAGLAIGWRLSQAGASVTVLERDLAGRGATWASAGMISCAGETAGEAGAWTAFARASRSLWPGFAREIEEASGVDIAYRTGGALLVATDAAQARDLRTRAERLAAMGERCRWLGADEAHAEEPMLAAGIAGALRDDDDAHVDNRALGDALAAAATKAGAILREHCAVHSVRVERGKARGVIADCGAVDGDAVVLAAGAWSSAIGGGAAQPVRPVKGQMIALAPPAGARRPRRVIWGQGIYLIPRKDRVRVGATMEEAGFDTAISKAACEKLHADAAALLPGLSDWSIAECWAGLRPAAPDGLPLLGPAAIANLFVASGQFRNGILFAPAVADALSRLVLGVSPSLVLDAFDPRRFSPES